MNVVDHAFEVCEHCQAKNVDGVMLDLTTARAIAAVWRSLSPANRKRLEAMSVRRAATICWKLVK